MKINWKVRFRNPLFIAQIILAIGVPILAYFGLAPQDLTTWPALLMMILDALKNPYVVGMIIVSLYNALTDPTVNGFSDSKQALTYKEPKKQDRWKGMK